MTRPKTIACWVCFLCLAAFSSPQAQETAAQAIQLSCRNFVQKFYDWYVPKALKEIESVAPASDLALKYKSSAFSPELVRALAEDSEAQAKVAGEIVGIDFDPFLFAQDPCERYVVGNITRKEDSYLVEVYGICSGKKHGKPDVVTELTLQHGRWLFVNFHYGRSERSEDANLVSVLKTLRENRQKHPQ